MNEALALHCGRRLALEGGWREGMLARLDGVEGGYRARVCRIEGDAFYTDATPLPYALAAYVPDLLDGPTRGAALDIARARWRRPDLSVQANRAATVWTPQCIGTPDALLDLSASSEGELLVRMIEMAPKPEGG